LSEYRHDIILKSFAILNQKNWFRTYYYGTDGNIDSWFENLAKFIHRKNFKQRITKTVTTICNLHWYAHRRCRPLCLTMAEIVTIVTDIVGNKVGLNTAERTINYSWWYRICRRINLGL
jgi:hypothetical protein